MHTVEKKFDKILRRLSSKNRRANRRHSRELPIDKSSSNSSSSASELDEHGTPSLAAARKSIGSRRTAQPKQQQQQQQLTTTTDDENLSASSTATIAPLPATLPSSYFQVNAVGTELCERAPPPPPAAVVPAAPVAASDCSDGGSISLSPTHDKRRNKFDDADYISDQSACGRLPVHKTPNNELDISMDESLPESSGRESGYLSGLELRYSGDSNSCAGSPLLPVFAALSRQPLKAVTALAKALVVPRCIGPAAGFRQLLEDAAIPDYASSIEVLVHGGTTITETKYVTTVFELTAGGIVELIDDVVDEFNHWLSNEAGLIGIACEVHWSVPEKYRQRQVEKRMKDALHFSLRTNNRRILNLKNKASYYYLPLTMTSAVTEEHCARNCQLNCFQGVYRRYYTSLLPYQHKATGTMHQPYWSLDAVANKHTQLTPNLQQFIFEPNNTTQLHRDSLIAVNVVALKIKL